MALLRSHAFLPGRGVQAILDPTTCLKHHMVLEAFAYQVLSTETSYRWNALKRIAQPLATG